MQFAFLIMGNFDVTVDRACIHDGMAQIIGVSSLTEACDVAKYLYEEGIGCIELCGAFGEQGAKVVMEATNHAIPIGYVTHLPDQDELYQLKFQKN